MKMFSEIIGHNQLLKSLESFSLQPQNSVFYGPYSVGKKTIALEIVKSVLCVGDTKFDLCNCISCRAFPQHPDFLQVGIEGKILVEHIDSILEFMSRAPMISKKKIVMVDNCDVISYEAANRLLKVVEETENFFFFITANIEDVLPTIKSRCIKFKFEALSREDITNILWKKMGLDMDRARALSWVGAGSSIDIFAHIEDCLKARAKALDFISFLRTDFIKSLECIDEVGRGFLPLFLDASILTVSDILLLQNSIEDIVNIDQKEELKKLSKDMPFKNLLVLFNGLTQLKSENIYNFSSAIKAVAIIFNETFI
jgi:DNA polymerase III subunit delta'